jgi:hypothetical protein
LRDACSAEPSDGDADPVLSELLNLLPTLTPDQQRQILATVRRMTR